MFLLSSQNNFCILLSSYVEVYVKKKFKSVFYGFGWFPGLQNLNVVFGKFTLEQVLKSFVGRNNSLKPPVFGFCGSFLHDLEEDLIELRAFISWVLGLQAFKNAKKFCQ